MALRATTFAEKHVEAVTLYYRRENCPWTGLSMRSENDSTWYVVIPAENLVRGERIEYYFEAKTDRHVAYAPEVDPALVPFWQIPH